MSLPNPFDLMAIADRIAGHATAARERASRLEHALAATEWRGFAADTFAAEAHVTTGSLRGAATGLDVAADALRRHAERISGLVADATRLGIHTVDLAVDVVLHPDQMVSDVGNILGDGLNIVGDGLDLLGL